MCLSHLKIYVLMPFLLMLLIATGAQAVIITTNASADLSVYGIPQPTISDPKTATSGAITSNLMSDVLGGLGTPGQPNPYIDRGNAIATSTDNGYLAVFAGSAIYGGTNQFRAISTWSTDVSAGDGLSFHISGASLTLNPLFDGSASYMITILNNNNPIWFSYASLVSGANFLVPPALTTAGANVNGTFYNMPFFGSSGYSFYDYNYQLSNFTAGTLSYTMEVIASGATANIGDPLRVTAGDAFSATIIPSTQVPEPATALLLGAGLLGVAGFRKRMQK